MKTLIHLKKNWVKCGVSLVIILGFLTASYYPSTALPRAEAGGAVVVVGDVSPTNLGTWAQSIISATYAVYQFISQEAIRLKEYLLDGIAFAVINMILQQMSRSIITWINSGFQGSPAFIQDLGGFLTGIADRVAGDYIWGSDLNFLCSPFQLDIRLALDIQYRQTRNFAIQNQCTLSGVVGNMQNFINGNFLAGGWNGWFTMTQSASNNPYGAMLMASEQFSARLSNSKGQEAKLLDFGKGLLSVKQCVDDGTGSGGEQCNIVTPGTAIESQLNASLDGGRQRIQVADEINEIVAALFSQLVTQAFSGIGGLLGLTGGGSGGTGSSQYYNALAGQQPGMTIPVGQNPIQLALTAETGYRNAILPVITLIQSAAAYRDNTYGVGNSCHSGALTPELQLILTTAQNNTVASNNNITALSALLAQYNAATTPAAQQAVLQQYAVLQTSGLHTTADATSFTNGPAKEAQARVDALTAEIDTACIISGGGGGN
jgi:hypothetical protein